MNLSLYLARRLYSSNSQTRRASRPAVRIATVGVAIGVAVMLLATAVALGFKDEISSKVIGFGAHVSIYDAASSPEQAAIPINAGDSLLNAVKSVPNVKHVQTLCTKSGILKTENDFSGITLKGIGANYDTSFIQSHIIEGKMPDFSKAGSANDIVVSYNTAKTMNLKTGDKVFAYFFENGLRTRRLKISAIYRTDLSQFDNVIVFASQNTVARLNGFTGNQVSGMEILLHDFSKLNETSLKISKQTSYYNVYHNTQYVAFNIKESYPQIFEWLDLLNINIVVILLLMILVAGVTIVSGLLILILERTGTIAMLKSIGATNTLVRRTFINLALIILLKGMLWGNIIGLALAFVQKEWGIVSLDPGSYYIDSVPIKFSLPIILAVNVTTFVVSTMALVLPSWLAARIRPSKILRFE